MEAFKVGDVIVRTSDGMKFQVDEIGDNYAGMEGEVWIGARAVNPRLVPTAREYLFYPISFFAEFVKKGGI